MLRSMLSRMREEREAEREWSQEVDRDQARKAGRLEGLAEAIRITEELNASWEAKGVFATSSMIVKAIRARMEEITVPAGELTTAAMPAKKS